MTQAPKEYIITEKQMQRIQRYRPSLNDMDEYRSRPHPAPPAPKDMELWVKTELFKNMLEIPELWKEHDAQVAKAAREHVLNAVLDGNAKRFCPSIDDTHYHCCDVEACIREIFKNYEESLRAQQQGGVSE